MDEMPSNGNSGSDSLWERAFPGGTLSRRLAGGAFWSAVGMSAYYAVWFATTIIIVRLLGQNLFGRFTMVTSTVGMVGTFAGLGLGTTAARHTALYKSSAADKVGRVLSLAFVSASLSGLAGTLLLLALSGRLASFIDAPDLNTAIAVIAPTVLFNTLYGTFIGALTGLEEFRLQAFLSAVNGLLVLPVVSAGILVGGVVGGLAGVSVFSVLQCSGGCVAVCVALRRSGISLRRFQVAEDLPILWAFSLPALLSRFVFPPIEWLAKWLIVRRPGGYVALGAFGVAGQWPNLVAIAWAVLLRPLEPVMSSLFGDGKGQDLRRLFRTSMLRVLLLSVVVLGAFALTSGWILRIYGREYTAYRAVLGILALAVLMQVLAMPAKHLIAAAGRMWLGFLADIAGGAVLLAVVAGGIRADLGVLALAAGWAAGYGTHGLTTIIVGCCMARGLDADRQAENTR